MNSRIRIAIAGAIVVGVVAALVAMQSGAVSGQPSGAAALTAGQGGGNGLAQGTRGTQTQTPGDGHPSATATTAAPPTRAPVPTATPHPCYTPTPVPVSTPPATVILHGDVTSNSSNNSFQFHIACGGTVTITFDPNNITFSGQITSPSAILSGDQGSIKGSYQSDGTFLATDIKLYPDN